MGVKLVILIALASTVSATVQRRGVFAAHQLIQTFNRYTNTWAVQLLEEDHDRAADQLAEKHGFINMGQVHVNSLSIMRAQFYSYMNALTCSWIWLNFYSCLKGTHS